MARWERRPARIGTGFQLRWHDLVLSPKCNLSGGHAAEGLQNRGYSSRDAENLCRPQRQPLDWNYGPWNLQMGQWKNHFVFCPIGTAQGPHTGHVPGQGREHVGGRIRGSTVSAG